MRTWSPLQVQFSFCKIKTKLKQMRSFPDKDINSHEPDQSSGQNHYTRVLGRSLCLVWPQWLTPTDGWSESDLNRHADSHRPGHSVRHRNQIFCARSYLFPETDKTKREADFSELTGRNLISSDRRKQKIVTLLQEIRYQTFRFKSFKFGKILI